MIYIFEDRTARQELHHEIVERHRDKICFAKFDIDEGQDLEDYIIENFHNAEIIIFHNSYVFKNRSVNLEEIRKQMSGTRFVLFSGGIENSVINQAGDNVLINADVMYRNLEDFLKAHDNFKNVNFARLVWGRHFRLNQLLAFQSELFNKFFVNVNLDSSIDNSKLEDLVDEIASVGESYGFDLYESLMSEIEGCKEEPLKWSDFLEIIQNKLKNKL